MRKFFQKIHVYGGFLFFPLLIIFGISALHLNHKISLFNPRQDWTVSQGRVNIDSTNYRQFDPADKKLLAAAIRDSLGFMGWCPDWTQEREGEIFRFSIMNPGAEKKITADLKTGNLEIQRRANGFGSVLSSLHIFNGNLKGGSAIINIWPHYKSLSCFYIILTAISGFYFFIKKQPVMSFSVIFLVTSMVISVLLMVLAW